MKRASKKPAIKVGVIGYGASFNMGRHHLREMEHAGMTPTAVCDIDPARLEAASQDFPGIELYGSATEMLKKSEVELVAVITPHNVHAKLAIQCLKAGRNVVTEKPFAITTAECDAMIAAAKKAKRMLSTYHNRHWDGCVLQALKTIRSGAIGDVYRVAINMGNHSQPGDWWRTSRTISGGILYDWGVHVLEYTLQIVNAGIVEVSGFAKNGYWAPKTPWKKDTNEDEAMAVIRFDSGAWATLCMTQLACDHKRPWLEITGTEGTYAMEHDDYAYTVAKGGEMVTHAGRNQPTEWWQFYENIAAHLTKGDKLIITPEWARRPIHIIDLACQSAKKGVSLKAKYK
jgi:predicted dehydrogenase